MALFRPPYYAPSVYIEIKAVGKLLGDISQFETQLRDYNRNNTATFSVITDGRMWRFYYSQTAGEFATKCFKTLDLINDAIEELESSFRAFLSKDEIANGSAKQSAEKYLMLSQKQRAMENLLPQAQKMTLEPPYPTLPQALVQLVEKIELSITAEEASKFIQDFRTKRPNFDIPSPRTAAPEKKTKLDYRITRGIPSEIEEIISPNDGELAPKEQGRLRTERFVSYLQSQGIKVVPIKGRTYKTEQGKIIGIASATEQKDKVGIWFLGLPAQKYNAVMLLCEKANKEVLCFVLPRDFLQNYRDNFKYKDQFKFHIFAAGEMFYIRIPPRGRIEVDQFLNNLAPLKSTL